QKRDGKLGKQDAAQRTQGLNGYRANCKQSRPVERASPDLGSDSHQALSDRDKSYGIPASAKRPKAARKTCLPQRTLIERKRTRFPPAGMQGKPSRSHHNQNKI